MGFRIIPRIIPESYLKLPNSEPWYICKIRTCVLWALFFATIRHGLSYASCCFWEKFDNSTLQRAAAPFTSTLAARVGYSTYPPCSTLKHHPLQQHQQASSTAPSSSTFHPHPLTSMPAPKQGLQHTPLWQQHLQSSPSGSTCSSTLSATSIAPNCTHHSDSKQHPAPAPCSGIPTAQRRPLQSAHTTLTAARTASTACQLQSAPRMV